MIGIEMSTLINSMMPQILTAVGSVMGGVFTVGTLLLRGLLKRHLHDVDRLIQSVDRLADEFNAFRTSVHEEMLKQEKMLVLLRVRIDALEERSHKGVSSHGGTQC